MLTFSLPKHEVVRFLRGNKVTVKINGEPCSVWREDGNKLCYQGKSHPAAVVRFLADGVESGELVTFTALEAGEEVTVIRPKC